MDAALQIGLLPVELQRKLFERDVEKRDFEFMVECAGGVVVEGLAFGDPRAFVGEPVDVGDAARVALGFNVRDAVREALSKKKLQRAAGASKVVFVGFAVAKKVGDITRAEAEILSEEFEGVPLCLCKAELLVPRMPGYRHVKKSYLHHAAWGAVRKRSFPQCVS